MRTCYLNGVWVAEQDLRISAWDLAVMQGASCFEMCRSFQHVPFNLREHIDRLQRSCELLHIPLPRDFDNLDLLCAEVTMRNPMPDDQEHRLLIVVNAGAAPMYREIEGTIPHSYCYVATFPLRYTVQGFSKYFLEGVHCVTSKIQQVPDECVPSAAKHRSRLHFHLAQQQAPAGTWPLLARKYADDPEDAFYAEAPGANICFVRRGEVFTVEDNALGGISLATVKELVPTEESGLDVVTSGQIDADELWLTGTPFCMLPVVSLDGRPIGNGTIGQVFKDTLAKWKQLVSCDFEQQILDWDARKIWTPDAQRLSATKY